MKRPVPSFDDLEQDGDGIWTKTLPLQNITFACIWVVQVVNPETLPLALINWLPPAQGFPRNNTAKRHS
jgi:hypothetical protein